MTMCPYKWALYIASVLAVLWVTVEALMRFRSVTDSGGTSSSVRSKAKPSLLADEVGLSDDEDDSEAEEAVGGARDGRPVPETAGGGVRQRR